MRTSLFKVALSAALMSACQAQPTPPAAFQGQAWSIGPDLGPMMSYGYCPASAGGANQHSQGWYGPVRIHGGTMGRVGGPVRMHGGTMGRVGVPFDPQQTQAWLDEAKLQIDVTPEQEGAWSTYANAVEADRMSMSQMHSQMPGMINAQASAPDRLQTHLSLIAARLASLQQVEAATRAFYSVLTPEQRQRADRTLWSGCW